MCGICGIVSFSNKIIKENDIIQMRDLMENRGPDDAGLQLIGESVGLGRRRLRVIDLSVKANQPMSNKKQEVWVVFNGEIYNFQALRVELEKDGYEFKSQSDTEVIIYGYEKWGTGVFERLDGMFSIAIWDNRKQELILGRDRYGKKPLYFYTHNRQVFFSSDIKSIWSLNSTHLEVNYLALDSYLHHFSTTQDHCIFKGIKKLLPGHFQIFNKVYGDGYAEEYWSPSFKEKQKYSEHEVIEKIDEVLTEAVKKRLVSDVPIGTFLSGGVDSGLIVAITAQLSSQRCKTFSIGFEEQDYSELAYARTVSERYDTEHHEIILQPDVLDILPSLVWEYGEPFGDSSSVPTYYVSKAAREFVTVALTGDGGDELFGGYDSARAAYYSSLLTRYIPGPIRGALEKNTTGKLRTLFVHGSDDLALRHSNSMAFSDKYKKLLYTPEFNEKVEGHHSSHIFERFNDYVKDLDPIDKSLFYTLMGKLPNDYLIKIDVASMKNIT